MTTKATSDPLKGFTDALPDMSATNWAMFVKPQARMAEAMLKHNIETLEFLRARLVRDREFLGTLSKAETPTEAIGLWQGFWQKMMADYASETDKLASSVATLAEEAIRSASEEGVAMMTPKAKSD